jgi:hypothetical protein
MPVSTGFMYKVEWLLARPVPYKVQTKVFKPAVRFIPIFHRDKTDSRIGLAKSAVALIS